MSAQGETWKIGDLARATGLTVRTLHHYDQLGLLSPVSRTHGGHRCYTDEDVQRLHRIVALRSLGISLEQVGLLLDGRDDPVELVRRQLDVVDERIQHEVMLRGHLMSILQDLNRRVHPSTEQLLAVIEETVVMNESSTSERLAELKRQRERYVNELSDAEFRALRERRNQVWVCLGVQEQERLVAQRRSAFAVSTPTTGEHR